MTVTLNPSMNGRNASRRSLSQELDRLDKMLDGLAEAIPATVADAIKESVAPAIAEAVRATLMEIVANQDVLAMMRQGHAPEPASSEQAARKQNPLQRLRSLAASCCKRVCGSLKLAARRMTSPVQTFVGGTVGICRQVNQMWSLRKPVLVSLGAGMVVGAVAYASAPWLAGLVAGCGAASTTLLGQFAAWTRRLYASFSLG